MPKGELSLRTALLFLGLLLPILSIHYGLSRDSVWLVPVYAFSFTFYLLLYKYVELSKMQLVVLAVILRVSLFFGMPSLSDDYYRFVWDGQIWIEGINPYISTPEQLITDLPANYQSLYSALNSPTYHTTYPPLSQYIFALPAAVGIRDIHGAVALLRGVLLIFEIGVLLLLVQLNSENKKTILYAFNPLVVLELVGNIHLEGIVILSLLLAIWLYRKNKWLHAAIALAFGILAKLTPLMFLPILFRKINGLKTAGSYLLIGTVLVVCALPILNLEIIQGMMSGLDLFFRKFEFNAGLFFLIREIGFLLVGYDIVQTAGPLMSYTAFFLILLYSFFYVNKETKWAQAFTVILLIQLLLATTVHPWYIITLVALCGMTGYAFPVLWSLMAFFSYLGYSQNGYTHPVAMIALEYVAVLGVAGYEIIRQRPLMKYV
ncbi:MAG: glycosyltransferase 87 family protein [Reichenbachiella sp.]|uniref:glycosyltransferase 87 family protein n=1 Tax=Reichenbachiella sp. TaxID=2184521 RepID=UPI003265D51C